MSRLSQSAWLARRIRRRRQRRRHAILYAVTAVAVVLFLPVVLRLPSTIDEIMVLKAVSFQSQSLSTADDMDGTRGKCQPPQHAEAAAENDPVVVKGSGTYNLDKSLGEFFRNDTHIATNHITDKGDVLLSWSQYGQDVWIDTYFGQKRRGIFVEVGGYDGESHSNTLFFEKERGWQGILIEANPYTFELMKAKDRSCWMAHACIRSQNHSQLHFSLAGGITSALELASSQHTQRIQHDLPLYRNQRNWKGAGQTFCLACYDFGEILNKTTLFSDDQKGGAIIDFFSLDVEGAELELLRTLLNDQAKFPMIRLFTIEMQENAYEIRQFLSAHNYEEIATVGIDSVFVKKESNSLR